MAEDATAAPSCLTTSVDRSTPEPSASSTTVNTTGCLLLLTVDGEMMVMTGATRSRTTSFSPAMVEASAVPTVPASLVAFTCTL